MTGKRGSRSHVGPPLVLPDGHRVWILTDGSDFFSALEEGIRRASAYILIETYIISGDETGWRVARALVDASRRGVEVCLLYDGMGSFGLDPYFQQYLINNQVKVAVYHPISFRGRRWPWSRRNHRKSLVCDGRVGIVGGMNIAAEYDSTERGGAQWRDTSMQIEGPAVTSLDESFRLIWKRSKGERIEHRPPGKPGQTAGAHVRFMYNYLRAERAEIRRAYLTALDQSQRSVRICAAYFVPDRRLRRALRRAAKRGVQVEVIVAANTDVFIAALAARSYYSRLLASGVRLFEWHERVLHAKTAVVDGRWSTIGSSNLDYFSAFRNLEVNAVVVDDAFGRAMEAQFRLDRMKSQAITVEMWKTRPWTQRLFDWFFHQLARGY